jgi:glycosyltransferase involved in cell wall biosynthesis
MRIVMFGGFDPGYARNQVLRIGLRRLGVEVACCRTRTRSRLPRRTLDLLWRWGRGPRGDALLVPEFRHKDVPLARLLATLAGIPLVVDPLVSRHDTKVGDWGSTAEHSLQADHNRRIDRAAVRFADLVLCDTPQHARYFQDNYRVPAAACAVVPVGFDDSIFQPLPEPEAAPFRVAFFGSYLPLHGVDTIVRAAERLAGRGIRFLFVGGGQTFPHVRDARTAGLPLEVAPAMPPAALVERLRAAHVLLGIFGRSDKAQRVVPNKVYQGLALGRAVVTADTPALRDFFTPGEHLVAVPPGDAAALADAILQLWRDPAGRRRIAAQGARYVHARFAPETVAQTLLDAGRRRLDWKAP